MSKEETSATESLVPIRSEIDFSNWSKEKKIDAERLIDFLKDYYRSYSLSRGLTVREGEKSWYHSRDNASTKQGEPLIDISEEREIESLAHELAHDVLNVYLDGLSDSILISSTFKELFADLNQLYFTEAEPEDRKFERKIEEEPEVFEGVENTFDETYMETNVMRIERMTQLMERERYDEVLEQAEKLAVQDPTTPEIASYVWNQQDVDDVDFDLSHMIYDNIFAISRKSPITEIIETKVNILGLSQRINEELNSQKDNYQEELANSLNFELYRGTQKIEEILPDISNIGSSEDFILNALAQRKYGEKYEWSIDYPHNMGGMIAEDLYEHGWKPEYVLEDPEGYIDICQKSIKYNLIQNT